MRFNSIRMTHLFGVDTQEKPTEDMSEDMPEPSEEEAPSSKRRRIIAIPSQENPTDIVGPSQENRIDIVGPSQLNPPPFSFVCTLKPASYLKFAIDVLSDPKINQQGSGRIDADVNGFNITVQNLSNNVVGHLCLNPPEFSCTTPIKGKMVSFPVLSQKLADVKDEGPLHVFHVDGSDEIIFFTFVSVDIKKNTATLKVGGENSWKADYANMLCSGSLELWRWKQGRDTMQDFNGQMQSG